MRIVHTITKSERGGAQVYVLSLIRHQIASGHEVYLFAGNIGFLTEEAECIGAKVVVCEEIIHPIRPWHDIRAVAKLVRRLERLSPDLVHAHSSKAGLLARYACHKTRLPCLFTAHGWAFSEGVPQLRRLIAWLAEKVCAGLGNTIVNVSTYDRDLALRCQVGHSSQHRVIHNGIPDLLQDTSPKTPKKTTPIIVMVARFSAQKNQALLIQAFAKLKPPVNLCLIGGGPLKASCVELAQELGVVERIDFVGDSNQVNKLLAQADVFVLTTHYEGLPLTIIEAMRARLPVVANAVGGIPELIKDGVTGVLLHTPTPEAVADALKNLLDNPERAKQMGQRGRERYLRHFTEQQMLDKLDALYAEILARR